MNQDSFYYSEEAERCVALVCDGMGGAKAGDIASRLAVERFAAELKEANGTEEEALERAVSAANDEIYFYSLRHPECYGMGTTLVGGVVREDSACVVNVGDSRCYCIDPSGIRQVTEDHSVVAEMVRSGMITKEEARVHPRRNLITRALGTKGAVKCDLFRVELGPESVLLLCSDGLSNQVTEQEMLFEVLYGGELDTCCERLVKLALDRGAPDNVTVVLVQTDCAQD